MTHSKWYYLLLVFLGLISMVPAYAYAQQNGGSVVTSTPHRHDLLSITSGDYWFTFPENYWASNDGGKYIMIYISSVDSTTAFIAYGGDTTAFQVGLGQPTTFNCPLSWEMTTCDSIQTKAVHVWSNDASLFVDFNSHDAYTSDASYVIPSSGWGTSYVVASYDAIRNTGGYIYDLPSEFVLIANQDSTQITITPTVDLEVSYPPFGNDTIVAHPSGVPFTVTLNQGQVIQYTAVWAQDTNKVYDATGTQIVASNPIGVIGANSCANIPVDFPYCDFICEMIPPLRTWGQTYYTAPLYGRTGGDTYLVVGTQPNQEIMRTDLSGSHLFATLTNPLDHAWRHDVGAPSGWTSSAPFMIMQYSNSSTWPAGMNGNYDPFMMAVNSVDQFSTPVIFNVLHNSADQQPYYWHADIVARSGVPVLVNGAPIGVSPMYDDGFCAVYQLDSLQYRQYIAASDSGVTVSVYGDGFDEAVGYSGMIGVSTVGSKDFIAPQIVAKPVNSTRTTIAASDESPNMSGLSEFEIDTLSNMQLIPSPNFVEGSGTANSSFDLVVTDASKPAHATVRVLDMAGNYSTVVKDYAPDGSAGVSNPSQIQAANPSPNPADGSVTIPYTLQENSHISINLYDVLGMLELSILNADESAGTHSITTDVRLLPSGTYIYRIQTSDGVQSGRISIER